MQSAIEELMKGRTVVVVAHRLSTIQRADRIIVLDKGVIVQEGTHAELVQTSGMLGAVLDRLPGPGVSVVLGSGCEGQRRFGGWHWDLWF